MTNSIDVNLLLRETGLTPFVTSSQISDGYHTFKDLYDHRSILFMSLVTALLSSTSTRFKAYKSEFHFDGSSYKDMFLLMLINLQTKEQISYHLSKKNFWDICPGEAVDCCPEWDGHSSNDVLYRLKNWFL